MTPIELIALSVFAMAGFAPVHMIATLWHRMRKRTPHDQPSEQSSLVKYQRPPMSPANSMEQDDAVSELSRPGTPGSQRSSTRRRLSRQTSTTTYQRTARGKLKITTVDAAGQFITVENTGTIATEDMSKWTMRRIIDSQPNPRSFTFPDRFSLAPGTAVKVWARGHGVANGSTELVYEADDNWGRGINVDTQLLDTNGQVMATMNQKVDTKREALN